MWVLGLGYRNLLTLGLETKKPVESRLSGKQPRDYQVGYNVEIDNLANKANSTLHFQNNSIFGLEKRWTILYVSIINVK